MAIAFMLGIVLSDGTKTLYRDPRATNEEERPARIFQTAGEAMSVLPYLAWRKCGDGPNEVDAYGPRGEIYHLVQIDTSLANPMKLRRTPTKLTTGQR